MTVRVFLVEDMKQVQAAMADLFAALGDFHIVDAIDTEAEARLWLAEHSGEWDLTVVDLVLDQGSGMPVVAKAREAARLHEGRVVVFSDYASDGIRDHCLRLGADAVFLKSQMREFMDYCSELGGVAAAPAA